MPVLYIAASPNLSEWAEDVGLTKYVFKIGLGDEPGADAVAALNDAKAAGQSDWVLVKAENLDGVDEESALARLARKEKLVDPNFYPRLRGEGGVFKVKIVNVENHLLVKMALDGKEPKALKVKAADIAAYLIANVRPTPAASESEA